LAVVAYFNVIPPFAKETRNKTTEYLPGWPVFLLSLKGYLPNTRLERYRYVSTLYPAFSVGGIEHSGPVVTREWAAGYLLS
jgi:hypothetical protein